MEESPDLEWHPLGELLVGRGLVRPEDVRTALELQERTGQFLGEILLSMGLIVPSDVASALGDQYAVRINRLRWEQEHALETPPEPRRGDETSFQPLGQVLLDRGLITEDGLMRALREQKHTGLLLGEILVKRRWLTAEDIENALAEQQGHGPSSDDHAPPFYEVCDAAGTKPFATCSDFMEATDVAFDALDSRDPDELVIFKVDGDSREPVWTYSRAASQNVA